MNCDCGCSLCRDGDHLECECDGPPEREHVWQVRYTCSACGWQTQWKPDKPMSRADVFAEFQHHILLRHAIDPVVERRDLMEQA